MLKVTFIEFIFRGIPEAFIIIWGIYAISRQPMNKFKYTLFSISLAIVNYLVRFLPIHQGVNTIISTIFMACTFIIVGIPLLKSIYGIVVITLLLLVGEFMNIILLSIFNINMDFAFKNPLLKCVLGLPSLLFLILVIIAIRFLLNKQNISKSIST